jgi:hypothetical protein
MTIMLRDADGNEWGVFRIGTITGFSVEGGEVVHFTEEPDGTRDEWTEPLCDSYVRDVLPQWTWDVLDDYGLDPRLESS